MRYPHRHTHTLPDHTTRSSFVRSFIHSFILSFIHSFIQGTMATSCLPAHLAPGVLDELELAGWRLGHVAQLLQALSLKLGSILARLVTSLRCGSSSNTSMQQQLERHDSSLADNCTRGMHTRSTTGKASAT
jgi:hypothetical protein